MGLGEGIGKPRASCIPVLAITCIKDPGYLSVKGVGIEVLPHREGEIESTNASKLHEETQGCVHADA